MCMNEQNNGSNTILPLIWNVPYPVNPFFTGRKELLDSLTTSLRANQPIALTQPLAISGLGGVGKTQIALEYAYRYRSDYQAVLWVQADTRTTLISSLVSIADLLNLPEKGVPDQAIIITAVMRWMTTHRDWLLILDNSDDLSMVKEFIPPTFGGYILLTTRAQAMGRLAQQINVDVMAPQVGALFLLRRAGLIAKDMLLEEASAIDREIALEIVQELGSLPLALDQVGAYIEETNCSLSDYLHLYQKRRTVLLRQRGGMIMDHPEPVATTWSISFERIKQHDPPASELLCFCAFLYPDTIPEEIITQGECFSDTQLQFLATDSFTFNKALGTLQAYSFIGRDNITHTLSIHRLVQAVLKDEMSLEFQRQWAVRAICAVNRVFPRVKPTTWPQCERLSSNAQVCLAHIKQYDVASSEAAYLLNKIGHYLYMRGQYAEAEHPLKQSLEMREQQLGREHLETTTSMNNVALLYHTQCRYNDAEVLYTQALAIREKLLGLEHSAIATSLTNLAGLYYDLGKYDDAELLYKRALAIREKLWGSEHPDTAMSINNLAWLYYIQGKYDVAESLYRRVLVTQERQTKMNVARIMTNLALLYQEQGKYAEAESLLLEALTIREEWTGSQHPATAVNKHNLALLYQEQGKYVEAEELYKSAVEIQESQLGMKHPNTATSMSELGNLYRIQGEYTKAESLLLRALEIHKQRLGMEHPHTARSLNSLALLYVDQKKYTEAEDFLIQAHRIYEQKFGLEHPLTAENLANLVKLYQLQGKYLEVETLFQQALEIYKDGMGSKLPHVVQILQTYVSFLRERGREAEASSIEERLL